MRGKPKLIVPHRRHREGRTDYHLRLKLLKSRKPRLVVRRSLNNFICQIVKFDYEGDVVMASADSKELRHFGWQFHCGNTPAAYLTGLLCAERAKKHKITEAILDIGPYSITPGNSLFSALKGAVDGGLEIPYSEEVLPAKDRISGKHISDYAEKVEAENPTKYKRLFSSCIRDKADPKEMPAVFEETKKKILASKGERPKAHHAHKPEHEAKHKTEHKTGHKDEGHKKE